MIAPLLLLSACQSYQAATPAVLEAADGQTVERLKSVLADALNVASVELGPGDLTRESTVSVLPPPLGPYEDRSVAKPIIFDLRYDASGCYVVRRDTSETYPLRNIPCRPIAD